MDLMQLLVVTVCLAMAVAVPGVFDSTSLHHIANVSYATESRKPSDISSQFSPRMDFDHWKPLTGRGDPLRNDPTYDYEPPVLERVHYWADEARPEREQRPERKSEVLMLGISSKKPSVIPRQPPRRQYRPLPSKYEDYSYKLSEHYPMTILVPPPPPPPGHQPLLFTLNDEILTTPFNVDSTEEPFPTISTETTHDTSHLNSLYALQEANLIYQYSTTNPNWLLKNSTKITNSAISSDYAGWGPTTPLEDDNSANDTHNLIFNDNFDISKHPYSFYRPMLSEAPPPSLLTPNPLLLPTFIPTALPSETTTPSIYTTSEKENVESTTNTFNTKTRKPPPTSNQQKEYIPTFSESSFLPTPVPVATSDQETNLFGMLEPMLTMPLVNGPDRPEDNLYAHASENLKMYKQSIQDMAKFDFMQTMHPPPPTISKPTESTTTPHKKPFHVGFNMFGAEYKKPTISNLDPYIHMRFTTSAPTSTTESTSSSESAMSSTESSANPTYLIIQGHSKVKTYSSKTKTSLGKEPLFDEPRPNETNEVKHLHPITDRKTNKNIDKTKTSRLNSARNLKNLLDEGIGSIEIQETDVGIKYDVSDGSDVPVEIYRKGIVETDENNYASSKKRPKRQLDIDDLLPFDEDQTEKNILNFLKKSRNETGLTGSVSSALTSALKHFDEDR